MMHNVCSRTERVLRVMAGLALLSLLFVLDMPLAYIGLVGLIPIATAAVRYCPINHMLGIHTCELKQGHA